MSLGHGGDLFGIARARGWDWRELLDLSASINPLGPSPGVRAAIVSALERIVHYPEPAAPRLTGRLAAQWGLEPRQVLAGNGATELIHFLARVWPQERVTLAAPTFSEFHRAWPQAACVRWRDLARWPELGLLVVAQPNNPTGEALPPQELRDWLLATTNPVLVDESFLDFTGLPSMLSLAGRRPDLLVLRSLTKFHAMPGLRVGALAGSADRMEWLAARREPWQVNALAEEAALAALDDSGHAARSRELVDRERAWLLGRLAELPGLHAEPGGVANFLLVRYDGDVAALCEWFLDRRIILRDCTGWPGMEGAAFRFAIRTREVNERVVELLREYVCAR